MAHIGYSSWSRVPCCDIYPRVNDFTDCVLPANPDFMRRMRRSLCYRREAVCGECPVQIDNPLVTSNRNEIIDWLLWRCAILNSRQPRRINVLLHSVVSGIVQPVYRVVSGGVFKMS